MNKKKNLLLNWWASGGGSPSQTLIEKINSYRTVSIGAFVQKIGSAWRIFSPFNDEYAQYWSIEKEQSNTDFYMNLSPGWGITRYFEVKLPDSTTGTYQATTAATSYTSQVGATATLTFYGTGLKFYSYTDNRGGIWSFSVDGGTPVTISTYNSGVAAYRRHDVFPSGTFTKGVPHTVVATFTGADPLNPPSGGTARGWISRDSVTTDNTGIFSKAFYVMGSPTPNCGYFVSVDITNTIELADTPSHKEFAIDTRALVTTATENQEIPNHSPTNGDSASIFADVSTDRTLKINGIGTDYFADWAAIDPWTFAVGGDEILISEVYIGVNHEDQATHLFDLVNEYTFSSQGLNVHLVGTTLTDLYNSTFYYAMHSVLGSSLNRVLIHGNEINTSVSTSPTQPTIAAGSNIGNWNGISIGVNNAGTDFQKSLVYIMQMNPNDLLLDLSLNPVLSYQSNGTRTKVYPAAASNQPIDDNVTFEFSTDFIMGFVPDAYNELKSYAGL